MCVSKHTVPVLIPMGTDYTLIISFGNELPRGLAGFFGGGHHSIVVWRNTNGVRDGGTGGINDSWLGGV